MQVRIFDLETTTAKYFKRKASPFNQQNYIVAYGWKDTGDTENKGFYCQSKDDEAHKNFYIPDHIDLLVGHNLKFDMMWIWEHPSFIKFIERGGKIWDTQLAQYILMAQEQKWHWASLQDCSIYFGGDPKYDIVKDMWESGMDTPEIPEDILMEYLLGGERAGLGDIGNTELVFQGQLAMATEQGQLRTIMNRMESLLATTEMEYNGLKVDRELGVSIAKELEIELAELQEGLVKLLPELPAAAEFNWGSAYHVSALLFGGAMVYEEWEQHLDPLTNEPMFAQMTVKEPMVDDDGNPVLFKSGKNAGEQKTRNVTRPDPSKPKGAKKEKLFMFPGLCVAEKSWAGKRELRCGTPVYSTDKDTIDHLVAHRMGGELPAMLAKRAKLDKDLGTYYLKWDAKKNEFTGMLSMVDGNGMLHGSINHCATKTSRLSSSDPNLQNIPRGDTSDIKRVFISRFADGQMMEIDYSQLEVIVQGALSMDRQLCADIIEGVDFHCKRLSAKLNEPYAQVRAICKDDEHPLNPEYSVMRTHIKGFTFQRAYGAGAAAIAASTGVTVEEVETLIRNEDLLYPGVGAFDNEVEKTILATAQTFKEQDPCRDYAFRVYQKGTWTAPTGTMYRWRQHDAPDYMKRNGVSMTFSPTERKNWPVQGTGGEVVQMALGKLFRNFVKRGWWSGAKNAPALMVNTVHDCVWYDTKPDVTVEVAEVATRIMQNIPAYLMEKFSWEVSVPFRVEAEAGPNMRELHHLKTKQVAPCTPEWLAGGDAVDYTLSIEII